MMTDQVACAPGFLSPEARREWDRIVRILEDLGRYTALDRTALAMYCQAFGRWVEGVRHVREEGVLLASGTEGVCWNPWLQIASKAWDQLCTMLEEFGLPISCDFAELLSSGL